MSDLHHSKGWIGQYREQRQFYNLPKFLDLFFAPTNVGVGHIWLLLDLHHGYRGVDLRREGNLDLILIAINAANTGRVKREMFRMIGQPTQHAYPPQCLLVQHDHLGKRQTWRFA